MRSARWIGVRFGVGFGSGVLPNIVRFWSSLVLVFMLLCETDAEGVSRYALYLSPCLQRAQVLVLPGGEQVCFPLKEGYVAWVCALPSKRSEQGCEPTVEVDYHCLACNGHPEVPGALDDSNHDLTFSNRPNIVRGRSGGDFPPETIVYHIVMY